jgi:hypothetical protein
MERMSDALSAFCEATLRILQSGGQKPRRVATEMLRILGAMQGVPAASQVRRKKKHATHEARSSTFTTFAARINPEYTQFTLSKADL